MLGDGPDGASWAAVEFGGAPPGNACLGVRLATVAELLGEDPMASFPAAAKGNRPRINSIAVSSTSRTAPR